MPTDFIPVRSFDFTSSYPAVMIMEMFPMSTSEIIEITSLEQFERELKYYCCLFDVEIEGLDQKIIFEHPLSVSKCWDVDGKVEDNGRLVSCDKLKTTLTEQDFFTLREFYSWKHFRVFNFRRYRKSYLPTPLVKAILKLYGDKTELKGKKDKIAEYNISKGMLNATYGMTVTNIIRDSYEYTDRMTKHEIEDIEEAIKEYNEKKGRFLFYPWGVWIAAYARRNLFTAIKELGEDYIYSDTDSVKFINYEKHKSYFDTYNANVFIKLKRAMEFHGLDVKLCFPENWEGIEKPLGVWDDEGEYKMFKTLGAKRYMTLKRNKKGEDELNITVAGLNKEKGAEYLLQQSGGDFEKAFDLFSDELSVPKEYSGRSIHSYQDEEMKGKVTDYLGETIDFDELSGIYLEESEYNLSLSDLYLDYLIGLEDYKR